MFKWIFSTLLKLDLNKKKEYIKIILILNDEFFFKMIYINHFLLKYIFYDIYNWARNLINLQVNMYP